MSGFAADVWVQLQLRPIEAKLLALALDPAARGNEIATSAEKIISLLRARGVLAAEVFRVSKPTSAGADDTTQLALKPCGCRSANISTGFCAISRFPIYAGQKTTANT